VPEDRGVESVQHVSRSDVGEGKAAKALVGGVEVRDAVGDIFQPLLQLVLLPRCLSLT
jgi:hypothetical protein